MTKKKGIINPIIIYYYLHYTGFILFVHISNNNINLVHGFYSIEKLPNYCLIIHSFGAQCNTTKTRPPPKDVIFLSPHMASIFLASNKKITVLWELNLCTINLEGCFFIELGSQNP